MFVQPFIMLCTCTNEKEIVIHFQAYYSIEQDFVNGNENGYRKCALKPAPGKIKKQGANKACDYAGKHQASVMKSFIVWTVNRHILLPVLYTRRLEMWEGDGPHNPYKLSY